MSDSLSMAIINSLEHLSETESRHLLVERATLGNQVEEISMLGQLEGDVTDLPQL